MKKHGQVELEKRIDSFEAECRAFFVGRCELLPFSREGDRIRFDGGRIVKLSYVHNAAGRLTFFLCPFCGQRVRFLYLPGYKCRTCARLNYRSQQATKGSLADICAIPVKLGQEAPESFDFDYQLIRPRYMNKARFERLNRRFKKKMRAFVGRGQRYIDRLDILTALPDMRESVADINMRENGGFYE